jgi:DNA-binding transcriptional LysR family regulator
MLVAGGLQDEVREGLQLRDHGQVARLERYRPRVHPLGHEPFVVPVAVPSRLTVSAVDTMLRACVAGVGIAQVMAPGSAGLRRSGALEELFPDWPDDRVPLHAIYPTRRHRAAKVRAFTEFCTALLAGHEGPGYSIFSRSGCRFGVRQCGKTIG